MRKTLTIITAIFLVVCAAGLAHASVDNIYEVKIIGMKGDVKVDTKADGTWITPWMGLKLMRNAVVKTGADSWVEVVFDANGLNVLRIQENTQLSIQKAMVDMPKGTVLAVFSGMKPGSSFTVKTPTAACGIRGTIFGVTFDDVKQVTSIDVLQDKVYVTGLDADGNEVGREVTIPEGFKSAVQQGQTPETPEEMTESEKVVYDAIVTAIKNQTGTGGGDEGGTQTPGQDIEEEEEEPDPKDIEEDKEISPSQ